MPVLPTGTSVGTSLLVYRAGIPLGALTPYLWAGSTSRLNGRYADWHRVVGAEWATTSPAIPVAGLPAAQATVGIGRSLDAPLAKRSQLYLSLVFQ